MHSNRKGLCKGEGKEGEGGRERERGGGRERVGGRERGGGREGGREMAGKGGRKRTRKLEVYVLFIYFFCRS